MYFGRSYFGLTYFGPTYFGSPAASSAAGGVYFGRSYFGVAYFGANYFGPAPAAVAAAEEPGKLKRPGPGPFWRKYVSPPRTKAEDEKRKKPPLKEVRKLYAQARREIPLHLQAGLLPRALLLRDASTEKLPPSSAVDFSALQDNLEVLLKLVAAIEAAVAQNIEAEREAAGIAYLSAVATLKRKRDEEALIMILLQV